MPLAKRRRRAKVASSWTRNYSAGAAQHSLKDDSDMIKYLTWLEYCVGQMTGTGIKLLLLSKNGVTHYS